MVRRLVPLAAAAAAAALAWALSWQPYLGYDAVWALIWGQQTWHGHAPAIDAPGAPTAHPLLNAFATLLSPFGHPAQLLLLAAAYLALGGVAWCWLRLGGALFGRWVGAVSALILLTRPQLLVETSQAVVDVFFLACKLFRGLAIPDGYGNVPTSEDPYIGLFHAIRERNVEAPPGRRSWSSAA